MKTLQRAIERLGSGWLHLTLEERRKLASLRMNLRIIEDLHGAHVLSTTVNGSTGQATWRDDGDDTTRR